jgi:mRNA interferase MazF
MRGSEIQKIRPCVVISPDELNEHLRTVIVAPMTTGGQTYPWRVGCEFQQRKGRIALDQLRTVDRERLTRYLGLLPKDAMDRVLETLTELFAA